MPAASPARVLALAGAHVQVWPDAHAACLAAAEFIARTANAAIAARGRAVLGLATGATPEPVYARLVALHREGALSFSRIITYNLDEYYPIEPLARFSYRSYMHRHLFQHVDLPPNQAHVLDGTVPEAFTAEHAAAFDRWIAADGGLDFQLLGVGRNGHIGFNEPCDLSVEDAVKLPTRLVDLHAVTRVDAAREFGSEQNVIPRALTMGVAPILAARSILVLAFGPRKAEVVPEALRGPVTAHVPASLLQTAGGRVTWMLDEAAARQLV